MKYKLFFPGASGANDKHLHDRGLSDLARDSGADYERATRGPGPESAGGMVACWKTGDPMSDPPDGVPEDWEWVPSPPCGDRPKGDYWVGINPKAKPGPGDLARNKQLQGVPVELADLREWLIPIARGVPYSIGVDYDNGEPISIIEDRFKKYSARTFQHAMQLAEREEDLVKLQKVYFGVRLTQDELAELYIGNQVRFAEFRTYEEMDRELGVSILFEEALDHAVDALSINYRLNQFLILHLQLFEVSVEKNHLRDVCLAAMEASSIMESLKKNEEGRLISLLEG